MCTLFYQGGFKKKLWILIFTASWLSDQGGELIIICVNGLNMENKMPHRLKGWTWESRGLGLKTGLVKVLFSWVRCVTLIVRFVKGLTLEKSALKLITEASLCYQLSWWYLITLLYSPNDASPQSLLKLTPLTFMVPLSAQYKWIPVNCHGSLT